MGPSWKDEDFQEIGSVAEMGCGYRLGIGGITTLYPLWCYPWFETMCRKPNCKSSVCFQ